MQLLLHCVTSLQGVSTFFFVRKAIVAAGMCVCFITANYSATLDVLKRCVITFSLSSKNKRE